MRIKKKERNNWQGLPTPTLSVKSPCGSRASCSPGQGPVCVYDGEIIPDSEPGLASPAAPWEPQVLQPQGNSSQSPSPDGILLITVKTEPASQAPGKLQAGWCSLLEWILTSPLTPKPGTVSQAVPPPALHNPLTFWAFQGLPSQIHVNYRSCHVCGAPGLSCGRV